MEHIYFIQNTTDRSMTKIGKTRNLQRRLSQLQTGSKDPLEVVLTIPVSEFLSEGILHERFKEHRQQGEWFTTSKDIDDFIKLARDEYTVVHKALARSLQNTRIETLDIECVENSATFKNLTVVNHITVFTNRGATGSFEYR